MPPVTALRSPPDSRITGALSPVITDSSTRGDALDHFAVAGNQVAGIAEHDIARTASADAGHLLDLAVSVEPLRQRVGLGLAEAVGLRFAARFRHGFGEIREQHREPEPERDLQLRSRCRRRP